MGPLEPSPGYGPAVSCGISAVHSAIARVRVGVADGEAVTVAVALDVAVAVAVDAGVPAVEVDPPGVQAASAATAPPAPKNMPSERRLIMVDRSNSRPRS